MKAFPSSSSLRPTWLLHSRLRINVSCFSYFLSSIHTNSVNARSDSPCFIWRLKRLYTVPPGTIYPFAAVFSRSIRGAMPRFHLDNDAACRKFFAVLPNFTAACDSAVNSVPRWS